MGCNTCIPFIDPKSNCQGVVYISLMILALILIYVFLVKYVFKGYDILNNIIYKDDLIGSISWWPVTHFIMYFILGLLFPDCDYVIVFISIFWELIEEFTGQLIEDYDFGIKNSFNNDNNTQYKKKWIKGSILDIFVNLFGFYIAKLIVKLFDIDIKIPGINDFN